MAACFSCLVASAEKNFLLSKILFPKHLKITRRESEGALRSLTSGKLAALLKIEKLRTKF